MTKIAIYKNFGKQLYMHTIDQNDAQTDRQTCVSARMYARMHGHIRAKIQTSKLQVRS